MPWDSTVSVERDKMLSFISTGASGDPEPSGTGPSRIGWLRRAFMILEDIEGTNDMPSTLKQS